MALKDWLKKKGTEYKEYQAKAPERHQQRLERLKMRTEETRAKATLFQERSKLMKARQAGIPSMPLGGMSMFGPPQQQKKENSPQKRKKSRRPRERVVYVEAPRDNIRYRYR